MGKLIKGAKPCLQDHSSIGKEYRVPGPPLAPTLSHRLSWVLVGFTSSQFR